MDLKWQAFGNNRRGPTGLQNFYTSQLMSVKLMPNIDPSIPSMALSNAKRRTMPLRLTPKARNVPISLVRSITAMLMVLMTLIIAIINTITKINRKMTSNISLTLVYRRESSSQVLISTSNPCWVNADVRAARIGSVCSVSCKRTVNRSTLLVS